MLMAPLVHALGAVKEREVDYEANGVRLHGLLARDDSFDGRRPAVLVVHEWWGHDEHARNSARALARAGYVALALDMYGDGQQAHHPKRAAELLTQLRTNIPLMQARFVAAKQLLASDADADANAMAAIGYCFGGSVVLEMARRGIELQAVVSFHGALDTIAPARPGAIKPEILVLTGDADPFVPKSQVDAFDREMREARARYRIVMYPGAKHSFTNPAATEYGRRFDLPDEYHAEAAAKSWQEMLELFTRVFRAP